MIKKNTSKLSIALLKLNRASLKYLKAFIDLDAITLLVLEASHSEMNILLGYQGTFNKTTSYQHTLSKKSSAANWRCTVV